MSYLDLSCCKLNVYKITFDEYWSKVVDDICINKGYVGSMYISSSSVLNEYKNKVGQASI